MRKNSFLKGIVALGIIIGFFASCEKDQYTKMREAEQDQLSEYITTNYPNEEPSSSGLYFIDDTIEYADEDTIVYAEGEGREPVTGDIVKFHYEAFYLTGYSVSEESTIGEKPMQISLGHFSSGEIMAWHEAIYKMKEGGMAKLIVPSSLAYGLYGNGMFVPGYTPLIYRIEFLEIISNAPEI